MLRSLEESFSWSQSVSQAKHKINYLGEENCAHRFRTLAPEQEEDEYGKEQSEGAAHDAGDGTKMLLEVDQYHRVLLGGARGEGPQRLASCNKRTTRRFLSDSD